LKEGGMPDDG